MEIMNSITFDAFAGNPVMFALKNRAPFETNVTLSVGGAQGGEVTYTDLILNDDMSVGGQDCHWTFTAPDPGVLTLTTGGAIMGPVAFTYSINGDDPVSLDLSTTVEIDMWTGDVIKIDVIASGYSSLTTAWTGESAVDPNALVLGANAVSVEAGNREGGSWTFTATEAGTLTATVSNLVVYNPSYEVEGEFVPEEVPAVYLPMVVNAQMSFQINGVKAENGNEGYVNVEADDVVTISLAHNMATQFDATLNLTLEASSGGEGGDEPIPSEPDGSYNNPYILENLYGTLEVQMPEACTVYYKYTATADGCVAANDPTYALTAYFGENYTMGAYSFKAGDAVLINFDGMPGTYTVELYDPAVAKIGNVTYTSLGEALTAAMPGDVVTLLADVDAYGYLVLPVGVSVDLGEHTLSADYIYGSKESSIIGIPQKSQLNVPKGNLILGQAATNNLGQYVLPIWDEANNCYQMSLFVVNTNKSDRGLFIDEANETIRFQFKVQATTAFFETLMRDNGLTDNDMSVIIRLQWKTYNKDGEELGIAYQNFVYNDTQVSMSTGNYDLSFTLTGFSALNISLDDLVVVALVETASGADAYGTEWNINNAK